MNAIVQELMTEAAISPSAAVEPYSARVQSEPMRAPARNARRRFDPVPVLEALNRSQVFQQFKVAFTGITGLPLVLRAPGSRHLPLVNEPEASEFYRLLSEDIGGSTFCIETQRKLAEATHAPRSVVCRTGVWQVAVPVRVGELQIGLLQTGLALEEAPSQRRWETTAQLLHRLHVQVPIDVLEKAYNSMRVVPEQQQQAVTNLLSVFAAQLAQMSNDIVIDNQTAELPSVTRAKEFIAKNYTEHLTLGQVARAAALSEFHFCKVFKKTTGIHFTTYLSRVRVEQAKIQLANHSLRISEVAYMTGFRSLTHFNRAFRNTLGQSPTQYRKTISRSTHRVI